MRITGRVHPHHWRHDRSPHRFWSRLAALAAGAVVAGGCASDKPPDSIKIPAVSSLRSASDILIEDVETDDGAPKWINHDRVVDGFVYGIGIQSGGRNSAEDLFLAMHAARRTVVVWLESRGAGAGATTNSGHAAPLRIDPDHIDFERLAHNTKTDRWYALARLDIEREAASIEASASQIEQLMTVARMTVNDANAQDDARTRAALSLIYDIERRDQLDALYHAVTGQSLATGEGLSDDALRADADRELAQHGMRVIVDGPYVAGLHEAVSIAMGEMHLQPDEFGRGLVMVRLTESEGFGPGNPYLEIDGTVELSIDGEGRTQGMPFHVVSTGNSLEEARFRAARSINQDVAEIVRSSLRSVGGGVHR